MKKPSAASLVLFGFSLGLFTSANASNLGSSLFPDVNSGTYYDDAVGDLYGDGIITGYADGRFGPNDFVTRGQVAVMLQRFKNKYFGGNVAVSSSSRNTQSSSSTRSSTSSSTSSSTVSTVTVTEKGAIRFTTNSFKVDENETEARITLIRYGGNTGTVSVEYETANGTAESGSDYDVTSGRLTFADGETSRTFTIAITNDEDEESTETVTLSIKDASGGAVIGTPDTATLSIMDDDAPAASDGSSNTNGIFRFSAKEYEVPDQDGHIDITVERVSGTDGEVTVSFATKNGTATQSNYDSNSGKLTFAAGETEQTFKVNISDENSINGNKTVTLNLTNPGGGAEVDENYNTATLVIVDDEKLSFEAGDIQFKDANYDAFESQEGVDLVIERIGGAKGEVTVKYATENSKAKAGDDYEETSGTMTFKDGESQKVLHIPIMNDNKNDPDESFKVELSEPGGGADLGSPKSATVTIQ